MTRSKGHWASDQISTGNGGKRHRQDEVGRDRFGKKRSVEGAYEYQGRPKVPVKALDANSNNTEAAASRQWIPAISQKRDDHRRPNAATRVANPHELIFLEQTGNPSSAFGESSVVI
jgi:hypothetical protein